MTDKIRWGILSTGNIAKQFARALALLDDAELLAVGSRSQDTADAFGEQFNVLRRYASYEEVANDPDVDVVYIGTPQSHHYPNTMMCLDAGKAVLCEKPFAINAQQSKAMIDHAREKNLFIMEAVWTRFLPAIVKVDELLKHGVLGDILMVQADFGFTHTIEPKHRLFDLNLGGGALLDVGIYPVNLASLVFGKQPERIATLAHIGETGVDEQAAMIFTYDHNQMAILSTAIRTQTQHEAIIIGTKGTIRLKDWWQSTGFTLTLNGEEPQVYELPFAGNGYNYEAAAVMDCLRAGKLEHAIMPHAETLAIMRTLDRIRAEWGLTYPMEE